MQKKTCFRCGLELSGENFYVRKMSKDGLTSNCKTCINKESKSGICIVCQVLPADIGKRCRSCHNSKYRAYRATPEGKAAVRRSNLKVKYGISYEQYEEMASKQDGKCMICLNPPDEGKHLVVDHDHKCCSGNQTCGKCIRDLLCGRCNIVIGFLKEDPNLARLIADYLDKLKEED